MTYSCGIQIMNVAVCWSPLSLANNSKYAQSQVRMIMGINTLKDILGVGRATQS